MARPVRARDVFIAGGFPTVTYRSREDLEQKISGHLDTSNDVLSVSGPTKTGKTVLIKHVIDEDERFIIEGGQINSFDDFISSVLDEFDVPTSYDRTYAEEEGGSTSRTGKFNAGVAAADFQNSDTSKSSSTTGTKATRSPNKAAAEALQGAGITLVIDDFHYIESETQKKIIRFLKGLVADGLPVVLVSVPHRSRDAVSAEVEMTGRVTIMNVGFWGKEDLLSIARKGFEALNIVDPGEKVAHRLVNEAFESPQLMQRFCQGVCEFAGVTRRPAEPFNLEYSKFSWSEFFSDYAENTSKNAFDRLARGPRQRADRIARKLEDGRKVDIYGLVLEAIAHTGPTAKITYEQIRTAIRSIISGDPPNRYEVTRVLDEMAKIAKKQAGEPVVDWDTEYSTLYISDPYFSYYLRWGGHESVEITRDDG